MRPERSVVGELVTTLAPRHPELDGSSRDAVLEEVTDFVEFEIRSLPGFLRLPYRLGMIAFDWLPVLRHGRRFVFLDAQRRASYVAAWGDRGVGLNRDFIKLIRTCALLQFFDHPLVRDALVSREGGERSDTPLQPEERAGRGKS